MKRSTFVCMITVGALLSLIIVRALAIDDDGDRQVGVEVTPISKARFTDNGDGTVADNLIGLIWLKNANCGNVSKIWIDALMFSNSLYDGWMGDPSGSDCGLSDGSNAGDWRLPGVNELKSLIHGSYSYPALSNAAGDAKWAEGDAFSNVQWGAYWSSTTVTDNTNDAWYVHIYDGVSYSYNKNYEFHVWPVRGGQ